MQNLASVLENITLADITIVKTGAWGKSPVQLLKIILQLLKIIAMRFWKHFLRWGLFDKLVDFENPDQSVFELLKNYLETVDACARNKDNEKYVLLRLGFITKLLYELGYAIEANACVVCRKPLSERILLCLARGMVARCAFLALKKILMR
jgi:recombinational DNA repair protein (RecF pathway)